MQKQKQDKKQRIKQLSGSLVSLQLFGILNNYTKNTIGIFNLEHDLGALLITWISFVLMRLNNLFIYLFIYPLLS